jgi:YHS domain-containing protein
VSYILGFQVADLPEDGSYHKLQVRLVDGPKKARLTHRPGYYAPGAIDPLWRRSMAPAGAERSTEFAALTGLDPVYLTQGREVEGREDLYLVRDGFRYEFADERTLDRFINDPRPYTIRNDGNCPVLEGIQGDPDVYYVLDGEIYIFSTPSAQRKFRNHPERYVEGYVPPADGP